MKGTFRFSEYFIITITVMTLWFLMEGCGGISKSPPPTGMWKALEISSVNHPMYLSVHFDKYSSAIDIKEVVASSTSKVCKTKIENFKSHGNIQVGFRFAKGGDTVVKGKFFAPVVVTSRQSGKKWIINIVSKSPFFVEGSINNEENVLDNMGFIEITIAMDGSEGTARIFAATELFNENGHLIPMLPASRSTLLKIVSFSPSPNQIKGNKVFTVDERNAQSFFDANKDEVDIAYYNFEPETNRANIYRMSNIAWGTPGIRCLATVLGGAGNENKIDVTVYSPLSHSGAPLKISNELEIWQGAILVNENENITFSNGTSFREMKNIKKGS